MNIFKRSVGRVDESKCSFLEAEEEFIGINHANLGGRIAEHWNFPIEIRDAIAYHHRPDLLEEEDNTICLFGILVRSGLSDDGINGRYRCPGL